MPARKPPNVPPDVMPKEFLLAVMRDPEMPLALRNANAATLLPYTTPRLIAVASFPAAMPVITIEGGLPPLPGTETAMPDFIVTRAPPEPELVEPIDQGAADDGGAHPPSDPAA